jgi:deazaflavin-dependent oxidoreductase (nitroreductase family)
MDVDGLIGRQVQKVAGSRRFAPVAKHVVPRVDRVLNRVSGGRFVLSSLLVPSMVLTATGAKSGQPRVTPLATMPEDDGTFVVVGSNFGQAKHPGWTANLLKNPAARVTFQGRTFPVTAHLLDAEQKAEAWPRITKVWPTYDRYVELSGGRDLRVFRLVPHP